MPINFPIFSNQKTLRTDPGNKIKTDLGIKIKGWNQNQWWEHDEEEQRKHVEENGGLFENSINGEENSISMAVGSNDRNLDRQKMGLQDEMGF